MAGGIITHIDRTPVDVDLAFEQHAGYVRALAGAGWAIHEVEPADELPDSAFVEDAVVVCDGLAVLTRPGAPERRREVAGAERAARELDLEIAHIEAPGTLDGGDVLQVGTTVYVGRGGRTNGEGIRQLRGHLGTRGRTVVPVPLKAVLHLKSALTALPDGTIIAHDAGLVDASALPAPRPVPEEGGAHVVLLGGSRVLMAASAPRSAELFDDLGVAPQVVDISEFERMEGCVTCLSVLVVRT
jgi:dimethylargininase